MSRLLAKCPDHCAVDADDGFVVLTVDVRERGTCIGRDGELEEIAGVTGLMARLEESNAHLSDANRVVHSSTLG
jgi:hypothetical protein